MVIKFKLSALHRTRWYEIVLRFLFGGLATVATGMIAKSYGPVIGGLFLAFPAIFPATATLVEKHVKEKKKKAHIDGVNRSRLAVALEARGTAMGSLGLVGFGLMLWRFVVDRPAWLVVLAASLAWLVTSLLIWELRRLARGHFSTAS